MFLCGAAAEFAKSSPAARTIYGAAIRGRLVLRNVASAWCRHFHSGGIFIANAFASQHDICFPMYIPLAQNYIKVYNIIKLCTKYILMYSMMYSHIYKADFAKYLFAENRRNDEIIYVELNLIKI